MSSFSLIETMRYEPDGGIVRRRLHFARLGNSMRVLGFQPVADLAARVDAYLTGRTEMLRLRLEVFADGRLEVTSAPYAPLAEGTVWRVKIAQQTKLHAGDKILRHKTSQRSHYDASRAEYSRDEADEVLLANDRGELCEGTITTLFVDDGSDRLLTPPLSSGCLAGVLRTEMLCSKRARNQRLTEADLRAHPFYVGNSLRGLIPARLV